MLPYSLQPQCQVRSDGVSLRVEGWGWPFASWELDVGSLKLRYDFRVLEEAS